MTLGMWHGKSACMNTEDYISKFGDISKLDREALLSEMDRIWDDLALNNKQKLAQQVSAVSLFYSHPVWVLNGLYSALECASRGHRKAIAKYVAELNVKQVADYGGGSGVTARFISEAASTVNIEIIEPYPFDYFKKKMVPVERVRFVPVLGESYDLIISQDVLEHVDEPVQLAEKLVKSTKLGGYLIFANCFWPDIKCHLPRTFYLRYLFKFVAPALGLQYVGVVRSAEHAMVFQKRRAINRVSLLIRNFIAKIAGPLLNALLFYRVKVKKYFSL